MQHTATQCNTLQHTATHCNTLQHSATHCTTVQHTATRLRSALKDPAVINTVCCVLQCVAECCSVLQCVAVCCSESPVQRAQTPCSHEHGVLMLDRETVTPTLVPKAVTRSLVLIATAAPHDCDCVVSNVLRCVAVCCSVLQRVAV